MKLINIGGGKYINVDHVEALDGEGDFGCRVYMHSGVSFMVDYPLTTFVEMLNMVKPEMAAMAESLRKIEGVSKTIGSFAG